MTTSDSGSKAQRMRKAIASDEGHFETVLACLAILAEAEQETATAIEALRVATRERDEALANVARYEAKGPVLLVAEHADMCEAHFAINGERICNDPDADCSVAYIDDAYRDQLARCVAVVQRELDGQLESMSWVTHGLSGTVDAQLQGVVHGLRRALYALTGGDP